MSQKVEIISFCRQREGVLFLVKTRRKHGYGLVTVLCRWDGTRKYGFSAADPITMYKVGRAVSKRLAEGFY